MGRLDHPEWETSPGVRLIVLVLEWPDEHGAQIYTKQQLPTIERPLTEISQRRSLPLSSDGIFLNMLITG